MKKFHLLLLLFFALKSFSQKEANIWYFGEKAGLDFNTSPPTALTNGEINTSEGCSSFSDEDGNLLFYSDGITVWDKNHDIMKYEDGSDRERFKRKPFKYTIWYDYSQARFHLNLLFIYRWY